MQDRFGRTITYMRLSVTDLCNLRCRYCMPEEGVEKLTHPEMLTEDEMVDAVQAAADLGISKIRINVISVLLKPLFCAGLSAAAAWGAYRLFGRFLGERIPHVDLVGLILAVGAAVIVYVIALLLCKGLSKEDILMLPKGEKIAKTLEKYKVLG